jgi:glutaconate CoA-transferase subunit A
VSLELIDAAAAVSAIPDGASVAFGRPEALSLAEELVRQRRRDLHLIGVPTGARAVEMLIEAGCVRSLESSGVDLGEDGFAPAFSRAVEEGSLKLLDST